MIPYEELLSSLTNWRRRQGLPVSAKFAHLAPPPVPDSYAADAPTNFSAPAYHPPISPASRRTSSFSAVNIDAAPPPIDPDGITLMNQDDVAAPPVAGAPGYAHHEHTLAFGTPALPRAGTENVEEADIVAQTTSVYQGLDNDDPDATVAGNVTPDQLEALKLHK